MPSQPPNYSVNRTCCGLRPPLAGYVGRYAARIIYRSNNLFLRFEMDGQRVLAQEAGVAGEIGVLIVRGMGIQASDFADDFITEMNDRLDGLGVAHDVSPSRSWTTGASRV